LYNGTTLRYLRTLGLAAALVASTACASAADSPAAAPSTKIPIGATGAIGGVLVSAYGSVWTTDLGLNRLVRIDPTSANISGKIRLGQRPYGLAAGAGSVWVASQSANTLARVNPRTLKVTKRIRVGYQAFAAAFGARSVWLSIESSGTVVRINPRRNRIVARIHGFSDPNGLVYANRALWVSDLARGRVMRINPRTNRITARIRVPGGGLDHAGRRCALGVERAQPGLPPRPTHSQGHRERACRRQPARERLGRRRALGAEHRLEHDLRRRPHEACRVSHDSGRERTARRALHSGRRLRLDV
jgi:streptogramin lyase